MMNDYQKQKEAVCKMIISAIQKIGYNIVSAGGNGKRFWVKKEARTVLELIVEPSNVRHPDFGDIIVAVEPQLFLNSKDYAHVRERPRRRSIKFTDLREDVNTQKHENRVTRMVQGAVKAVLEAEAVAIVERDKDRDREENRVKSISEVVAEVEGMTFNREWGEVQYKGITLDPKITNNGIRFKVSFAQFTGTYVTAQKAAQIIDILDEK